MSENEISRRDEDGGLAVDANDRTAAELAAEREANGMEYIHPVPDPGLEEHIPRHHDVDEAAANQVTRQIVTLFALAPVLAIAFIVIYFAVPGSARADPSSTSAPSTPRPSTWAWA